MDICRVRYFLAVCEHGSFTAAAKMCGVSQPAVTTGIGRLERTIGGKLFERRHPVRLTALGMQMRPMLEALRSAADRVNAAVEKQRGPGAKADRGSVDLLERSAAAVPATIDDGNFSDQAPSRIFLDQFSNATDLRLRSSIAIELSERAIQKFERTRANAKLSGDNSSGGNPPDDSTLSG